LNVRQVSDPKTPIGDILSSANSDSVLIEAKGDTAFAVLPLNDELVGHLLEHNPPFIQGCDEIRQRMRSGCSRPYGDVKRMLAGEDGRAGGKVAGADTTECGLMPSVTAGSRVHHVRRGPVVRVSATHGFYSPWARLSLPRELLCPAQP